MCKRKTRLNVFCWSNASCHWPVLAEALFYFIATFFLIGLADSIPTYQFGLSSQPRVDEQLLLTSGHSITAERNPALKALSPATLNYIQLHWFFSIRPPDQTPTQHSDLPAITLTPFTVYIRHSGKSKNLNCNRIHSFSSAPSPTNVGLKLPSRSRSHRSILRGTG